MTPLYVLQIIILHLLLGCIVRVNASEGSTITEEKDSNNSDGIVTEISHHGGLRWQNLGVSLESCDSDGDFVCSDDSLWLLHPSSGFVENGSTCGILGPSGAGKTTLLHALGGTISRNSGLHISGSVWYDELILQSDDTTNSNSTVHARPLSQKDGDIAMLWQHDNFFEMLTPRESLEIAAFFEVLKNQKHNNAINRDEHKELAEKKLALLGLSSVADNRIGDRSRMGDSNGGKGWNMPLINKVFSKVRRKGGLSGGERRRLSVAHELVSEPKAFLADEPTTGLDSSQAERVVKLIARLGRERSIPSVIILHQPKTTIWQALDSFILLAPGGKMCYSGKREEAVSYFKKLGFECPHDVNPSEYFIDLVTVDTEDEEQSTLDRNRIDFLHKSFMESQKLANADNTSGYISQVEYKPPQKRNGLSIPSIIRRKYNSFKCTRRRFCALLQRSWRQNSRNVPLNLIRLLASVIQAVLFSTIFDSIREGKSVTKSIADRVALLTYGVINMSMMSLMKTLDLFARERAVVNREQMRTDYSSLEYLLAKVVAEMPLDAMFSWVFAMVLKHLTALRTSLVDLAKTYVLMTVSSVSLGFAIGSVTSSVESAMSVGVPLMVIFMIVGVINPSGVSEGRPNQIMACLKTLSPIRWAIEAVVTAEFRDMIFPQSDRGNLGNLKNLPKMGGLALVKDGNEVLRNLGLEKASYSDLMNKLGFLSGFYLVLSWLGLIFAGPKFI